MILISEQFQYEKLKKLGINIRTGYISRGKFLERNSDGSKNDIIEQGIRYKKEYFLQKKKVLEETLFDTRVEYSFGGDVNGQKEYRCPNCGMIAKAEEMVEGCPYCGTNYNIDYTDKDLGGKYHFDLALKKGPNNIIAAVVIYALCIVPSYFFIKNTSNSFNIVDIAKIFIYAAIAALVIFYIYYRFQTLLAMRSAQRKKEQENLAQERFWKRTQINQKQFFNNFNHELAEKYYRTENIVDYDIMDFTGFQESNIDGVLCVEVKADIRIVRYDGHALKSEIQEEIFMMKRLNETTIELKDGVNILMCPSCGSPINVKDGCCEHCGTKIRYYQQWEMM